VPCRSQDNPRRTVPDGVPPGAANLSFRCSSCPRRLDRPVLGSSASGFPTTARASAFVCSSGKKRQHLNLPLYIKLRVSFSWCDSLQEHNGMISRSCEKNTDGE
jgi:hypothetical protein